MDSTLYLYMLLVTLEPNFRPSISHPVSSDGENFTLFIYSGYEVKVFMPFIV